MPNKNRYSSIKRARHTTFILLTLICICCNKLWAIEPVSLNTQPDTGVIVPNPMEIAKLPRRKTYQVNHEAFTLQFFFNEKDIFAIILKRDNNQPIHFRWCFYKTCEESPHDYKKVIAEISGPPFARGFFSIPFPFYLPYSFQGIEFSSPKRSPQLQE